MIHEGKSLDADQHGEHRGQAALFWPDAERGGRVV